MNGYRPGGGKDHTFDFKLGWPKSGTPLEPSSELLFSLFHRLSFVRRDVSRALSLTTIESLAYINASVTQLFYTNSMIHDLFYHCTFPSLFLSFSLLIADPCLLSSLPSLRRRFRRSIW